jgi:hypothetical protein
MKQALRISFGAQALGRRPWGPSLAAAAKRAAGILNFTGFPAISCAVEPAWMIACHDRYRRG